jgi:serine/threonine-protein kinase HipA
LSTEAVDTFDLLSRFGRETAGAVMISASPELLPEDARYNPLPRPEFLARVREMRREGGSLLKAARMSLAGAQDKMAVRLAPSPGVSLVDGLHEPVDQAPTSHILKPQPPMARRLQNVAINEFFCMTLAKRLQISVPEAHLLYAPGPEDDDAAWDDGDALEWIYCVRRFDRVESDSASGLRRLHQIDFLQLRNEWATHEAKYEKSSGAGMDHVFRLSQQYASAPAASMGALVRQRIMSFLIGNSDAHWKNHSLMWNAGRWDVSPAYDLVCTVAYPQLDAAPALTIGGCENEDRIEAKHFMAYFEACLAPFGSRLAAVTIPLLRLGEAAPHQARLLYEELASRVGESNAEFLRTQLIPVVTARARRAVDISRELSPRRAVGGRSASRSSTAGQANNV